MFDPSSEEGSTSSVDDELRKILHDDASQLASEMKAAYNKAAREQTKANVLLAGVTGSGKSSLINSIFGVNVAEGKQARA